VTRSLLSLALVASLSSCSWAFVRPPPPPNGRSAFVNCTSAYGAPVFDTVFATLFGVGAAILVGAAAYNEDDRTTSLIIGGSAYGAVSLGLGVSALGGYRDIRECRRVKSGGR
jgi:hypothetical protein